MLYHTDSFYWYAKISLMHKMTHLYFNSYNQVCVPLHHSWNKIVLKLFSSCSGYSNYFTLLVLLQVPKVQPVALITSPEDSQHYEEARQCVEELALYLKPLSNTRGTSHPQNIRWVICLSLWFISIQLQCCNSYHVRFEHIGTFYWAVK